MLSCSARAECSGKLFIKGKELSIGILKRSFRTVVPSMVSQLRILPAPIIPATTARDDGAGNNDDGGAGTGEEEQDQKKKIEESESESSVACMM